MAVGDQQRREQRQRWFVVGAAMLLAVGAAVVWAVVAGRDGDHADGAVSGFTHVHGLEVPAWDSEAAFLSTHEGLFRIEDGQWSAVSELPHDFMGFTAHPIDSDVVYSSGHPAPGTLARNPVGFMVSVDGGATWEVRSLEGAVDFHAMTVGADGDVIYGWNVAGEAGLYRSSDDGHSWQTMDAPQLQAAGGALSLAGHPGDPDVVWAGTPAGLLLSTDGGAGWQPIVEDAPVTAIAVDPSDPERMLAYAPAPGDGLIESVDAGRTWSSIGWMLEAPDDAVGHLAIHPDDPQSVYAGSYGENLYRSGDGGRTWDILVSSGRPGMG